MNGEKCIYWVDKELQELKKKDLLLITVKYLSQEFYPGAGKIGQQLTVLNVLGEDLGGSSQPSVSHTLFWP